MLVGISGYIGSGKDTVARMTQYLCYKEEMGFKVPDEEGIHYFLKHNYSLNGDKYWQIRKFAGKLKQIVSLLTGIPVADLEKESIKSSFLGDEWNYMAPLISQLGTVVGHAEARMSVRDLLQKLGTDAMRDKVHPNIHVNGLFADYQTNIVPSRKFHRLELLSEEGDDITFSDQFPNWLISDLRFGNEMKAIKDRDGICIRINREQTLKPGTPLHSSETALDQVEFDYTIDNSGTLEELLEQVRTMLLHFKIIA